MFILPLSAQETDLHGKITLSTAVPLKGVHVRMYDLADTTRSYVNFDSRKRGVPSVECKKRDVSV